MNISKDYSIAYVQVLEVLKGLNKKEYEKIPKERIELYEKNKSRDYEFKLDKNRNFNDQISQEAQKIIANLFVRFIATPEDRIRIYEKEKKDFIKKELEERKKIKLNPLFKENNEIKQEVQQTALIIKREGILNNFIEKIKKLFRIGKRHG